MSEQGFKVVFEGKVIEGFDEERVKENLAALHKIGKAEIEKIFTKRRVVIKKGISHEAALRYRDAYARAGAECLVLPMEPFAQKAAADIKAKTPEPANTAASGFQTSKKSVQPPGGAAGAQTPSGNSSQAAYARAAAGSARRVAASPISERGRVEGENRNAAYSTLKIIVILCAGAFFQYVGHSVRESGVGFGLFIILGGLAVFTWGCMHFAARKGYHKAFGLLGIFSIFGLAALLMFPNRYSTNTGLKVVSFAVGALFFVFVIVGGYWQQQKAQEAFTSMDQRAEDIDSKLSVSSPEELNASVALVEAYILQCNKMMKSRTFSKRQLIAIHGNAIKRLRKLQGLMEREDVPEKTVTLVNLRLRGLLQEGVDGVGASRRGPVKAFHDLAAAAGNL